MLQFFGSVCPYEPCQSACIVLQVRVNQLAVGSERPPILLYSLAQFRSRTASFAK